MARSATARSEIARRDPISAAHPLVASLVGAVTHAIAIAVGFKYNVGYASLAIGSAVAATLIGTWAWASTPRLARTSVGLGLVSVLTLPGWWAGWPLVLGLSAVGLAVECRRRVGSLSRTSIVGLATGLIGYVGGIAMCLTGSG